MSQTTVTIEIENLSSQIIGLLSPDVINQLSTECSYFVQGAEFSPIYRRGHWDGSKKLFNARKQSFPSGLLSRVKKVLDINQVPYTFCDTRTKPLLSTLPIFPPGEWRDYQLDTIEQALSTSRGTVKVATGGGKSLIMAGLIAKTNIPTLVITHTSAVFEQTIRNFEKWLQVPIGRIGAGEVRPEKFTVGLIQALVSNEKDSEDLVASFKKRKVKKEGLKIDISNYLNTVQSLIVDEAHHTPCNSVQIISSQCPNAFYRFSLSASPWRDDHLDILLEAVSGRQIVDYSASHLIRLGYLSKPDIHLVAFKHKRQPSSLNYNQLYQKEVSENTERNELIVKLAEKHIEKNNSVLISVQRIKHGILLESMLKERWGDKVKFVNGEKSADELFTTLQQLNSKSLLCCIATQVYKEGVDIPSLDVLINSSAMDSTVAAFQLTGRVLRKTESKSSVTVYDICDEGCRWLSSHAESRINIYRTESEFQLIHDSVQISKPPLPSVREFHPLPPYPTP